MWTAFYLSNEKSKTQSVLTYCRKWKINTANADICDDGAEQTSELGGSFVKAEANCRHIGFITREIDQRPDLAHQCQSFKAYDKGRGEGCSVSSTPHWCPEDCKGLCLGPTTWRDSARCSEMAVRCAGVTRSPCWDTHLSKMAPTPALWALFLCTCSPVASRMPSFTEMERWEKEAIRSSFHPVGRATGLSPCSLQSRVYLYITCL